MARRVLATRITTIIDEGVADTIVALDAAKIDPHACPLIDVAEQRDIVAIQRIDDAPLSSLEIAIGTVSVYTVRKNINYNSELT